MNYFTQERLKCLTAIRMVLVDIDKDLERTHISMEPDHIMIE
jgi:hypothetical protein